MCLVLSPTKIQNCPTTHPYCTHPNTEYVRILHYGELEGWSLVNVQGRSYVYVCVLSVSWRELFLCCYVSMAVISQIYKLKVCEKLYWEVAPLKGPNRSTK